MSSRSYPLRSKGKFDKHTFFLHGMFAIGRPPYLPTPRRQKRNLIPPTNEPVTPKFTGRPSSWLLLPISELSFFERCLDINKADSFTSPYLASISFYLAFPEGSVAYCMSMALHPSSLSYNEICESVQSIYAKNIKIRWAMKKLMNRWRMKHIRVMNEEDIATQETPKKVVRFINWKTRTSYQFEAITILRDSINRLLNHDQLFLQALPPRNPFTNSHFTYGGLISLHDQLRRVGVTHWLWEAFAASNFDIETLERMYEVPMKLRCLEALMADKTNYNTIDFVMDFVIGEYAHHVIHGPPNETTVMRALITKWDTPKIQEWVKLCNKYWMNEIRGRCDDNYIVHVKSESLIRSMKSWHII